MRIIYMGTPDFAVPSLAALVEAGENVVAVITSPDKPAGRGLHLQQSPVKQYALSKNIPVLQPEKLKNPSFIEQLKSFKADLQIVVAFRMLPEMVWNMPPLGTLNLHASLLPDYRGAAPINWAIINGEKETGLTTFFLKHEIDTGDIIMQEKLKIDEEESAGELHDRIMRSGAELIVETVSAIKNQTIHPIPQANISSSAKLAPKIFKEDCFVNWKDTMNNIHNFIRGLSPYPAAWTLLDGKVFKIYKSNKEQSHHTHPPGWLNTDHKRFLKVSVNGGYICLTEVQLEGKKRMPIEDFLRGNNIKTQSLF